MAVSISRRFVTAMSRAEITGVTAMRIRGSLIEERGEPGAYIWPAPAGVGIPDEKATGSISICSIPGSGVNRVEPRGTRRWSGAAHEAP